jgi:glycosyltransferase involved in cell wall biosynthesis
MKLSIITPTLGRPTLKRAVDSALAAMGPVDELIVVGDGPQPNAHWCEDYDSRLQYVEYGPTRCWGAAQYDWGMELATGDWIMFLPDDDMLTPHACDSVRRLVTPGNQVHVFACLMQHWGIILCKSKLVCEVTLSQLVVPNIDVPVKLADDSSQTFDHAYLTKLLKHFGQSDPVYHDEVIGIADQHNNGREF